MARRPTTALAGLAGAAALAATGCGSGGATNGGKAINGQGHNKLPPPYTGPAKPLMRVNLDAGPSSGDNWSHHPVAKPGQEISIRLRIRNAGSVQTGDVIARLRLPPNLQLESATVAEFKVTGAEPGQPLTQGNLLGSGVLLGPFPGYGATQVRAIVRARRAGGGPMQATATVTAPGTSARDTLTFRLS